MSGWNLKSGSITEYHLSEDRIWSLFNFVFSDASQKRNTYKFGLIKSLLDNIFNGVAIEQGMYYTYEEIFSRFAENYWNLIVKYGLKQMRKDGRSEFSRVETIYKNAILENPTLATLEFESIDSRTRSLFIKQITAECKTCVVGALYNDFDGTLYTFDLKTSGLILNYSIYEFMLKYKAELEKLNYYSWAKFLEKVNRNNSTTCLIEKLELETPRRKDLSIYREILRKEFEDNTCFYCGKKLQRSIHVDHFIPWSFVKDDKIWNFVLSCPSCNEKKKDRIPAESYLNIVEDRNKKIQFNNNSIIQQDFEGYNDDLLRNLWHYAKLSGIKEYNE